MTKLKKLLSFRFKSDYLNVFFLALFIAAVMFLPYIIIDKGYFFYYGDFNAQQLPFYQMVHDAVRSGDIFWNWYTDLGVNFIGSYSFYLLGSPFFWITLLFPSGAMPFLMAPLLVLKFALAAVTGFAFIKRFTLKTHFAVLGALMYAFSGFNLYNIFFNHFHEAVIIFPLILVAMEELVMNNRRGTFALAVFAAALINYYFFFGQVIFAVVYFLIRCTCKDFRDSLDVRKFIAMGFEAVIGVLMSCILLLPAVVAVSSNPRLEEHLSGFGIILFSTQKYGMILQSLFMLPDIPARPNFFPETSSKWASISAYLPLFGMVGVLAFVKNFKKNWLRKLLLACAVMAAVPILNSAFSGFNSGYYARWFYMATLIMSLVTVLVLEKTSINYKSAFIICTAVIAFFASFAFLPTVNDDGVWGISNLIPFPRRLWLYIGLAAASTVLTWFLVKKLRHKKHFLRITTLALCVAILANGWTIMSLGRTYTPDKGKLKNQFINGAENIHIYDNEFYRINTDKVVEDNAQMYWKMPSVRCFHSVVPTSVMDFYNSFGSERIVASRPDETCYGAFAITSVKYFFCDNTDSAQPYIPGFVYYDMQNDCTIYENTYFIPMGFTYDKYMSKQTFESFEESARDEVMVHAVLLSDEDINKYGDLMSELISDGSYIPNEVSYFEDCEARRETAGYYFSYDKTSFTSKIVLDKENLVFYSVPYEAGWSAYVNGVKTEIIKVNNGLMAIKAPAGDNEIVFKYETPGLKTGVLITLSAVIILILYMGFIMYMRKKKPQEYALNKNSHRDEVSIDEYISASDAYIKSVVQKSSDKLNK